ncbi:MAG: flavin-containing monooxygenase [Corynebacterium sp.]|uniref:flavin-containing monooxygenase n=1 Tax=Corynebacterium sp. TaxID=1720 RepID=UPI003F9D192C
MSGTPTGTAENPLDLLIVGAGLSGIDLAHHVAHEFPDWDWEIHDANSDLGGTWHTFTYPGIRSDSDMATYGFPFAPWPHEGTLGQGPDIKEYIRDVAARCGALDRLRTESWIRDSNWLTDKKMYAATAVTNEGERTVHARRVHYASGYYAHGRGHRPDFPGEQDFRGTIIHPQEWPADPGDMDCAGRRITVIGSGATAVTLVPALEREGAYVTMLQRSPTYVAPLPEADKISGFWNRVLPSGAAYPVARLNHAVRDMVQQLIGQRAPRLFSLALRRMQRRYLDDGEIGKHFTPRHKPWEKRVCKAPNGDLFSSLGRNAAIVTDTIDRFTTDGIRVGSGDVIPADIIVTATGMDLLVFGGGTLSIDGHALPVSEQVLYRGMMLAGLPNFSFTVGYINGSWTLRSDLVSRYMVKLWKSGEEFYCPAPPPEPADRPLFDFAAAYLRRGADEFPAQGYTSPWLYTQNYLKELLEFTFGDQRQSMTFGDRSLALAESGRP